MGVYDHKTLYINIDDNYKIMVIRKIYYIWLDIFTEEISRKIELKKILGTVHKLIGSKSKVFLEQLNKK